MPSSSALSRCACEWPTLKSGNPDVPFGQQLVDHIPWGQNIQLDVERQLTLHIPQFLLN